MSLVSDKLKKIVVTFDGPPTLGSTTVAKSLLRYNKRFAMTFQMDDDLLDLYAYGYKYLQGGVIGGTTYPGVTYTDGCGNPIKFKITGCIFPFSDSTPGAEVQRILDDNTSSMYLSWPQISEMRKNGHAFVCHGISPNAEVTDYELARAISYARQKTWLNGVPGGMRLYSFTPPNGSNSYTTAQKAKYFRLVTREGSNYGMPTSNIALVNCVNGVDDLYRMNAYGANSILDRANQAYNLSLGTDRMWSINFNHSLNDAGIGYSFSQFKGYIDTIYNTYGSAGNDTIWFATEEEIHNYMILRDAITPSFTVVGNTIEITFAGTVDDALNYYGISLNVASDKNIVSITANIDGTIKSNGVGKTSGLINIDWNGKNTQVAEDLAELAVQTYEATSTLQTALVARDYIEMCGNGRATEGFKARIAAKINPFPLWTAVNQDAQVTQGVAPGAGNALVGLGDLRPYGSGGPANYTQETQASRGGLHTWNNWRDTTLAAAALVLKKADGTITPWTFKLTKSVQSNYFGGGKVTGGNTGFFPDRILSNVAFSNSGSPYGINSANAVEWTISGLTQANTYTIRTIADRDNTYDNSPRHAVNGVEKLPLYKQNTSAYLEWLNVVPIAGSITLRVYGGDQWGTGFINGVEIIEVPGVVNSYYPGAATNLTMTLDSAINQYKLAWSAADAGLTNWEVWRADQETGEWAKRADVVAANSFYVDNFVSPNKSYHYKIKTVGPDGTLAGFSASIPFTYPEGTAILTPPTGLAAFNVKANGTSLSWGSVASNATRVKIYRKLATDNTYVNIDYVLVANGSSYIDTTASPSTAYNYAISIWNTGGESALSMALDVTTLTPPPIPVTPTGLTVGTPKDMTTITVGWVTPAYADNILVYKYNTTTTVYDLIATVPAANSSYLVTGLVMSTNYSFKIAATNVSGTSIQTTIVSGTTSDPPIPSTPSVPTCTSISEARIDITWSAVTWATSYKVYRSTSVNGAYTLIKTLGNIVTTSDIGLPWVTSYFYKITAINITGESAQSLSGTATTLLPPIPGTPSTFNAVASSSTQIDLTWTTLSYATGYNIYKSATSTGTYTLLKSVGAVAGVSDTGLDFLTPFFYKISSTNIAGESAKSTVISATTQTVPAPTGFSAIAMSDTAIKLSWNAVALASDYQIFRSNVSGVGFTPISTTSSLTFDDVSLTSSTTEYYKVVARNVHAVNGTLSSEIAATTNAPPSTTDPIPDAPSGITFSSIASTQVTVSWGACPRALSYEVFKATAVAGPYTSVATSLGTVVNATLLLPSTTYYFKIVAINGTGSSSSISTVTTSGVALPASPTGVVASASITSPTSEVNLSWNVSARADGYKVYQSSSANGTYTYVKDVVGTSAVMAGLNSGVGYYFKIVSFNASGTSGFSSYTYVVTQGISAPLTPQGVTVVSLGNTSTQITWETSAGATGYTISRSSTLGGTYSVIASVGMVLTVVDSGLVSGRTYYYKVSAFSGNGNSLSSSPILITTNSDGTAFSYGFSGIVKFGDEVVVGATVVIWDMTDNSVGAVLTSDSDGFYHTTTLVTSHDYLLIGYLSNVSGSFGSFSRILGRPVIM